MTNFTITFAGRKIEAKTLRREIRKFAANNLSLTDMEIAAKTGIAVAVVIAALYECQ